MSSFSTSILFLKDLATSALYHAASLWNGSTSSSLYPNVSFLKDYTPSSIYSNASLWNDYTPSSLYPNASFLKDYTPSSLYPNASLLKVHTPNSIYPAVSFLKAHAHRVSTAQAEHILFIVGLFSIILWHTRHQVPIYHQKFHKRKIYLYIHILTGLSEAFKYRVKEALQGHSDTLPDIADVLSCLVWSWTSFQLVRTLRRGDPRTTRPPYQAAACLRPAIAVVSYLWEIPSLHRVSIKSLDSFLWARLVIFFFSYTPYISSFRPSTIYAFSIPLASTLSVHESRVPGASLVFVLAVALVTKLNSWVTQESQSLRK